MRIFLGLWLPSAWREELGNYKQIVPGVKWVEKENLHLTLRFLGELADRQVLSLEKAISDLVFAPFTLLSAGPGAFPGWQQPRVLWWGIRGQTGKDWQGLIQLKQGLDRAMLNWGLTAERGRWQPHITLARVKEGTEFAWHPPAQLSLPPWPVESFALIASTLTRQGPIYRNLCEFSLKGQEEKQS